MTRGRFAPRLRGARFALGLTLSVAAAPASAATGDTLRAALSLVPAAFDRPDVDFHDYGKMAALTDRRGAAAIIAMDKRLFLASGWPTALELALVDPGPWRRATGFGLEHISMLLRFDKLPGQATVYGLTADAPKTDALIQVWAARGFREIPSAAGTLWGRGEPMKMDPDKEDSEDPFGGHTGRGSFLLVMPPGLVESSDPARLVEMTRAKSRGGLAARADMAALLAALDRDFGAGMLLQAWIVHDPVAIFNARDGIAAYTALMLADIEHGAGGADTVLALAFSDCATAKAAQADIERRWPKPEDLPGIPPPKWGVGGETGPCLLIGRVHAPGPAAQRDFANDSYSRLLYPLTLGLLEAFHIRQP